MPRIRCLAGPTPNHLFPISINDSEAHEIKSDLFHGKVAVFIKLEDKRPGSSGRSARVSRSPSPDDSSVPEYFKRPERKGITWSIQVQGRFLKEFSADDILFGNTFDRPLQLPWGSSAVLKFMNYIDPTLEHDLSGQRPWALAPLISTMPHFHHRRQSPSPSSSGFPSRQSIIDCTNQLPIAKGAPETHRKSSSARRAFFASEGHRKMVKFGPKDVITTDFCYGFLKFPELSLQLPAGLSFDLTKYWDGQPVRFVCCERHPKGFRAARTFWCVVFEIIEDDDQDPESSNSLPDFNRYRY